ncbi:hypothetical protein [Acetobacter musti]|nr:hypothetical protein [Acetobacter musti]
MLLTTCPSVMTGRPFVARSSFLEPTEADLHLYRTLAMKLRVQPPSSLFRYLLPQGQHLMHLGDRPSWVWANLLKVAQARWPDLPPYGNVASDGTALNSTVERIVYEAIVPVVPDDVAIDLEAAISSDSQRRFHSDIAVRLRSQVQHIEIVGACGSDRVTRNEWEQKLLAQFDRRLLVYEAAGIQPEVWYLDQMLEPDRLRQRFLQIVAGLRKRVS